MSAFSEALAAALRELLSSTLGVPEEGMRDTPLPELVRALQREWEALLEGLVRNPGARGKEEDVPSFLFLPCVLPMAFSLGVCWTRAALHAEKRPCGRKRMCHTM